MAVQSTLRPSKERVAQLVAAYAKHRPLVQRGLTAGFVIYVISTTYKSLAARPPSASSASSKRKGKGKEGDGVEGRRRSEGDAKREGAEEIEGEEGQEGGIGEGE